MTVSHTVRRTLLATTAVALALIGAGCGGDDESAAEELARQGEIAAARSDAAREARQAERVRGLQREVEQLKRQAQAPTDTVETPTPGREAAAPAGDWPGGSAYTAILGSLASEAEARQRQAEASGRGLDAGVLFSSDFSSLRPGYWVVFSGSFGAVGEAEERVARARELGYADAYPRFVAP